MVVCDKRYEKKKEFQKNKINKLSAHPPHLVEVKVFLNGLLSVNL